MSRFCYLLLLALVGVSVVCSIGPGINQCMLHCDYDNGFMLSPRGCFCVRIDTTCSELKLPCPAEGCSHGTRVGRDDNGCLACMCRTPRRLTARQARVRCPPVCAIYCPNGNVLDRKGCPTCTCKPGPVRSPWQHEPVWVK